MEVVSLVGAYRLSGMSGSLEFHFRVMGLVWLVAVLVFTCFSPQALSA